MNDFVTGNEMSLTPRPPPTRSEIDASMKYRPKVWLVSGTVMCWLGRRDISKAKMPTHEDFIVRPCRRLGCTHAVIERRVGTRPTSWREIG